jgi:uncharacterized membrane protein YoaK (UPF0700 family)
MGMHKVKLLSILFAIVSGIINIMGINQCDIVLTNVTGHFSNFVQEWHGQHTDKALLLLGYISIYWLGAFVSHTCFLLHSRTHKLYWKALPLFLNLLIVLSMIIFNTFPVILLFFAMSNHNGFASNNTQGKIKPSQLTGIIMDIGAEIAKYLFGNATELALVKQNIQIRFLNVIGFVTGAFVAAYFPTPMLLWAVLVFYIGILSSVVVSKLSIL